MHLRPIITQSLLCISLVLCLTIPSIFFFSVVAIFTGTRVWFCVYAAIFFSFFSLSFNLILVFPFNSFSSRFYRAYECIGSLMYASRSVCVLYLRSFFHSILLLFPISVSSDYDIQIIVAVRLNVIIFTFRPSQYCECTGFVEKKRK